ncbi:fimbrial protein [Acinetobacter rudis]|uniref:Fimbrial protein n=1 Tax=Acinetobacter rudis TaxID=632955 RepID=A0AAW8J6A5_9GAMM|nr:fimbrial protein [Acinetobacter rudis]MDQ8935078.1 fimbrial protein [Acinetobacter rudis]MDQ9017367.1 fimbrial protein [Acinetobacter rudis]
MKFIHLLCFMSLSAISSFSYAKCSPAMSNVAFGLGGNDLIINKMTGSNGRQIAKDARPSPDRYATVFSSCDTSWSRTTNSFFVMGSGSSLNPSDKQTFATASGPREFLAVNQTAFNELPAGAVAPKVYISFAVYDPKPENAGPVAVITDPSKEYPILKGNGVNTSSIGLVLEKVYLYIIPYENSIPGNYKINNLNIGQFFTRTYSSSGAFREDSVRINVNISPALSFQIKQSTCTLDQKNYAINLKPVVVQELSNVNQVAKLENKNIILNCPDESSGIGFNATLTDNDVNAQANEEGVLKNNIAKENGGSNVSIVIQGNDGKALPISSRNNAKVFQFGSLNTSKQIIFPIKVGYKATIQPATPGIVKATAHINIDYN